MELNEESQNFHIELFSRSAGDVYMYINNKCMESCVRMQFYHQTMITRKQPRIKLQNTLYIHACINQTLGITLYKKLALHKTLQSVYKPCSYDKQSVNINEALANVTGENMANGYGTQCK